MALPPFLKWLEKHDPEFAGTMEKIVEGSMGQGPLDEKTKLLIAMAVDAADGSARGVSKIAERLRAMGVTEAEIAQALRIAYYATGNRVLNTSFAAFSKEKYL